MAAHVMTPRRDEAQPTERVSSDGDRGHDDTRRAEGSASDEAQPTERVSSDGSTARRQTMTPGRAEGSASDEAQPTERVSSDGGH